MKSLLFCFLWMIIVIPGHSQVFTKEEKLLFTPPNLYIAFYSNEQITIDGKLLETAWKGATWSENFVDIEGSVKPEPSLHTAMKMFWNDSCLYLAARLQEPHLWATLHQHDAVVFQDNDFEVFLDPFNTTQPYFEIEVNAFNTIFDLLLPKPYRNGGSAMIGYNVPGLQSAIQMQGTLNNPNDIDSGWIIEMVIPFSAVTLGNNTHVPGNGEQWRINFSRVEWDMEMKDGFYTKKKDSKGRSLPEHNWVWSPQGVVNMHYPERWGYVQFNKSDTATAYRPADEAERNLLWLAYYRQKAWQQVHGSYALLLADLNLTNVGLQLAATGKQFLCSIGLGNKVTLTINQDGFISVSK